jgi:hypothetical protein
VGVDAIEAGVVRLAAAPVREYRAVLEVGAPGAAAPDDEGAALAAYAAFLNALTFPVQILVRALPYDLDAYVDRWARRAAGYAGDGVLAELAADHVAFLRRLARGRSLLERRFFVVVPAESAPEGPAGRPAVRPEDRSADQSAGAPPARRARWMLPSFLRPRGGAARARGRDADADADAAARRSLAFRCSEIARQFARCGLAARRLDDAALAELFYACWCPERARVQRLRQRLAAYTSPVVRSARPRGSPPGPAPAATAPPPVASVGDRRHEGESPCA